MSFFKENKCKKTITVEDTLELLYVKNSSDERYGK